MLNARYALLHSVLSLLEEGYCSDPSLTGKNTLEEVKNLSQVRATGGILSKLCRAQSSVLTSTS